MGSTSFTWMPSARQGKDALYQEFLRLKARLEAEGLFDEDRKRPHARAARADWHCHFATGAALQDMFNTLQRRYPAGRGGAGAVPLCRVMTPRRKWCGRCAR